MAGTTYRGNVAEGQTRGGVSIAVYSLMRLGLLFAVWLLLQLVTPLRGLWAVVVAVVVSGVISLFLLQRQRAAMSAVVGGFFGRINARIDQASRAEDDWDDQSHGHGDRVEGDHPSGRDQGRDQSGSAGSGSDDANRPHRPGSGE